MSQPFIVDPLALGRLLYWLFPDRGPRPAPVRTADNPEAVMHDNPTKLDLSPPAAPPAHLPSARSRRRMLRCSRGHHWTEPVTNPAAAGSIGYSDPDGRPLCGRCVAELLARFCGRVEVVG